MSFTSRNFDECEMIEMEMGSWIGLQEVLPNYVEDSVEEGELTENDTTQHTTVIDECFEEEPPGWNDLWKYKDRYMLWKIFQILFYLSDVFSDLGLAIKYLVEGQIVYASLTCAFVYVSSIYLTYYSDRRINQKNKNTWKARCINALIVIFAFEPILNYTKCIYNKLKMNAAMECGLGEKVEKYKRKMERESFAVAYLKFDECYLEAVPQIILQLSIILQTYGGTEHDWTLFLQLSSLLFSIGGAALTLFTWQKEGAYRYNYKVTWTGRVLWLFGVLGFTVSRILAIVAAVAITPAFVLLLFIHWMSVAFWDHFLHKKYWKDIFVSATRGVTHTFIPLTNGNGVEHTMSLLILGAENVFMLFVWAMFADARIKSGHFFLPILILIGATTLLASVCEIIKTRYWNKFATCL